MAKTESTAVNELINLVQSKQAPASEPAADLFAPAIKQTNPARMTTAVPTMRGAGEVAPLPRGRTPQSTSRQSVPPPIRMSTAEESRGNTIPPLSRATVPSLPNLPPPSRNTIRGTQPPPAGGAAAVPHRTAPPPSAPVAAPFEARRAGTAQFSAQLTQPKPVSFTQQPTQQDANPLVAMPLVPQQYPIIRAPSVDMTGDMIKSDNWFELSGQHPRVDEPETWLGTAPVVKQRRQTIAIIKKLIAPTIILAIVGIMVGGYFVFDGQGGKKRNPKVAAATAPAPATNAATAPKAAAAPAHADAPKQAAAQPEPAKQEVAAPAAEDNSVIPAATTAALTHDAPKPAAAPTAPATAAAKPAAAPTAPAAVAAKPAAPAAPAPSAPAVPTAKLAAAAPTAPAVAAKPAAAPTAAPTAPAVAAKPAAAPTAPAAVAAKPAAAPSAAPAALAATKPGAPTPAMAATPPTKPAATPTKPATTTPTAPPIAAPAKAVAATGTPTAVREVKTPQGVLKFVDVRIDSKPSGATVMLVDNGKTSFLGSTPIATSLDPSRSYDVIFTLAGRPTQMAHLDPSKSSKLDVTLGRSVSRSKSSRSEAKEETKAKTEPKVEAKAETKAESKAEPKAESKSRSKSKSALAEVSFEQPKAETKPDKKSAETKPDKKSTETKPDKKSTETKPDKKSTETKSDKKVVENLPPATDDEDPLAKKPPKRAEPKVEAKPEPKVEAKPEPKKAEPAGQGTLMVSSKPPCEIWIDGKSTGLTTPQKSIALSAGTHKVTFVNDGAGIKKTVSVSITADQPTKLIQDLMK